MAGTPRPTLAVAVAAVAAACFLIRPASSSSSVAAAVELSSRWRRLRRRPSRRKVVVPLGPAASAASAASTKRTVEIIPAAAAKTIQFPRGGYANVETPGFHRHDPPPIGENVTSAHHDHHNHMHHQHAHENPRLAMYLTCLAVVLVWVITGTLVYTRMNGWPLATSFFYAVDAGMSIGFCTDVAENTVKSRAFSVVFILLGASVVGGALAVLVADVLEGVSRAVTAEWRTTLERDAFLAADKDGDGTVSYAEMGELLSRSGYHLPEEQVLQVCRGLDRDATGRITYSQFLGTFRGLGPLIRKAERRARRKWRHPRILSRIKKALSNLEVGKYRMFLVFSLWVLMGIIWGMLNQKWDPITATHFAISALATGGLTAPPVNEHGVLPNGVALFVGFYCLLGIPLFYLAMGHFAQFLVRNNLAEAEQRVIETPLRPYEYNFAKTLCSKDDVIHLSDFVVLHFLRRGLTDIGTIELIKGQFRALDEDGDGVLSFEEATSAVAGLLDEKNVGKC